jgi:NAD(P)H dehydrogenase (quinone)
LKQKGSVVTRDLYAINFDPLLSAYDLSVLQEGEIPDNIQEEQKHFKWADTIFFIFPLWWAGPPAILKWYIDRIFCKGFAYDLGPEGLKPLLPDKKLQIITTLGESRRLYEKLGMFDSLTQTMGQIISDYSGIELLPIKFFTSVTLTSDDDRKNMLDEIKVMAEKS